MYVKKGNPKFICRKGLRKCWKCKKILPLNLDNFYKSHRKEDYYFSYLCKNCYKTRRRGLTMRFKILQKFNFTCQYCGRKAPDIPIQVDHIIPESKGGKYIESNLVVACFECNIGKSDSILN